MYDSIVIGSGPAGVFTAYQLRPQKVLMLDVGYTAPERPLPDGHLMDLRNSGQAVQKLLLGDKYEGLEHLDSEYLSPKLKGPLMRYVWQRPDKGVQILQSGFDATLSYARGGLANAWGAGVLRYSDRDLADFPISSKELDPYYAELTRHIGITGAADDLEKFFGSTEDLLEPMPLGRLCQRFFDRYGRARSKKNEQGFFVGRPRAAVLPQTYRGRAGYQPNMDDFFQPGQPAIYNPAFTLDELLTEQALDYASGYVVESFSEQTDHVSVRALNIKSNTYETFRAKRIFLAAGAINSALITLRSYNDQQSRLPILDNPVCFVPFVDLGMFGEAFPFKAFQGGELLVVNDQPGMQAPLQASVYSITGPLRSDLIAELPLSIKSSITVNKFLSPALGMLQIFYPDREQEHNYLQLNSSGALEVHHSTVNNESAHKKFVSFLNSLGYFSSSLLCKKPIAGSSIHYAGALPMRAQPTKPLETTITGRLNCSKAVYVVDAATFPALPSKNHTFTIMANAMRIAELAKNSE